MSQSGKSRPFSRREFLKFGAAAATAAGLGGAKAFVPKVYGRGRATQKVIVIGMDGLDHGLFGRWVESGTLPTFEKILRAGGDFRPLGTSIPPQSPVAWSNFITGTDPGGHGIYDFLTRDPKTYIPEFSATETDAARRTLRIGNTVLPLSGGRVRNLRGGRAFWQVLEDHDVPATVIRIPSNYPPVPTRQLTLSGMNTPDIKGSYGIFNYYTNEPRGLVEEAGGGGRVHEVYVIGNRVEGKLPGPNNSFRADGPEMEIDFKVFIDPVNPVAKVVIQGREFILKEKEWSGWQRVSFGLFPTQSVGGICLFYLKEVRPKFKLYVSPIHIDPGRPALPISTPDSYARELERRFGPFFTKGLPADTAALDNDVLDEEEFLRQDDLVLQESLELMDYELSRFDEGLLFYYFSSTDQRQHMFWRLIDPGHPAYDPELAARYGGVIKNVYVAMDRALDRVMKNVDKDTLLLVMSDHGFNPFRRGFNLNTWLMQSGYHRLARPWQQAESSFFDNTDWSKTRAYGVGLNGLYINERGREREGVVGPGAEKANLVREIAAKLEGVVDPVTGEHPVLHAYVAGDVYHGAYLDRAPDIVLGFNRGYRISWQSPLGGFPKEVLENNTRKWSGDHMGSPDVIPGVVLANRAIRSGAPALYDLTATVLDVFGINKSPDMIGTTIL